MTKSPSSFLAPPTDPPGDEQHLAPHPIRSALAVAVVGYLALTALIVVIGLLITHAFSGSVGGWDEHVAESFARHRTDFLNDITKRATSGVGSLLRVPHASLPAMIVAAGAVVILVRRGRWREGVFLAIAFALELTVYRTVIHLIARQRPHVFDLSKAPSNTSYPSGHTAAATVMFVGIALVVFWCTSNRVARILVSVVAVAGVFMVGFARVYRGNHSLLDVLAGVLLDFGCLAVASVAVSAMSERVPERESPGEIQ